MLVPNLILMYVSDPLKSAEFYERIFDLKPAAAYPTYVAFTFPNGLNFALWSTTAKDFTSMGNGNCSELAFMVPKEQDVRHLRERWGALGVTIEQDLFRAVFGLTFVALDPDGHRIRVCVPDP